MKCSVQCFQNCSFILGYSGVLCEHLEPVKLENNERMSRKYNNVSYFISSLSQLF